MKRYSYDGKTPRIDERSSKEFLLLFERGILIALQKEGLLSAAQLEQCIALFDTQKPSYHISRAIDNRRS